MQLRIFTGSDVYVLQEEINDWLKEQGQNDKRYQVVQSQSGEGSNFSLTVSVLQQEKS
jgi:hypothetical protein